MNQKAKKNSKRVVGVGAMSHVEKLQVIQNKILKILVIGKQHNRGGTYNWSLFGNVIERKQKWELKNLEER